MNKKKYEPIMVQVVKFETENVLSASDPFMGDTDEFSLRKVSGDTNQSGEKQGQINPA